MTEFFYGGVLVHCWVLKHAVSVVAVNYSVFRYVREAGVCQSVSKVRLAKPAYWVTGTAGSNPALSAIRSRPVGTGLRRGLDPTVPTPRTEESLPPRPTWKRTGTRRRHPETYTDSEESIESDEAAGHKSEWQNRIDEEPLCMWGIRPYRVCRLRSVGA